MKYEKLAKLYEEIEKTSKRLEKSFIISKFLENCDTEELEKVIYLIQGKVFPQWDERKLGMSSKLLLKAIAKSTGESTSKIENLWRKLGDLGLVTEELMINKKQQTLFSSSLSLKKVIDNIKKLSEMEGEGTVNKKVSLISELLGSATGLEAKFIIRTVTESLRTGVGDSMVRDSLVWTFYPRPEGVFFKCEECGAMNPKVDDCMKCGVKLGNKKDVQESRDEYNSYVKEVQHAFDVSSDFGLIAKTLKEKGREGLKELTLTVGKPIKVMLYPKVDNVKEGFEVVGEPAIIEPKLDGFRVQIHRKKDDINLFTRRLENVSKQFPDVIKVVRDCVRSKDVILDTEVVGMDKETNRFRPFQEISQRIKRKHDVERLAKELPVMITVFDVIELNGENTLDLPLEDRKKKLKAIIKQEENVIEIIDELVTSDLKKAENYYKDCLARGHEGVMMKKVEGIYKPGKRVGQGVKVKPVMESLDLVVVEAEWGEGKRAKWLSSFTVACRDGDELKEIGKVGTGIKEKSEEGVSFQELTDELKPLIMSQKGKTVVVRPKVVLELLYEEIQKSPSYSSGFALRFPRVLRLREDKGVSEISTLKEIYGFFKDQKKRK